MNLFSLVMIDLFILFSLYRHLDLRLLPYFF